MNRCRLIFFTFIWVRLFWNQNLTCRVSKHSRLLSSCLCFSSGWGHSLNNLQAHQLISEKKKKNEIKSSIDRAYASSSWICCGVWRWYRFFLRELLLLLFSWSRSSPEIASKLSLPDLLSFSSSRFRLPESPSLPPPPPAAIIGCTTKRRRMN